MAFYKSKYTGTEIDQRLTQGTYDDAVKAGFTGSKEEFDKIIVAFDENAQQKLDAAQPKIDHRLETLNKSIVDAINELHDEVNQKQDIGDYADKGEFEVFKDEVAATYATKGQVSEETDRAKQAEEKLSNSITTVNSNLVNSINILNKNVSDSLKIVNEAIQQSAETLVAEIEQRKEADSNLQTSISQETTAREALEERVSTLENADYQTGDDVTEKINEVIDNALDAPGQTASTGEVISSVSQENGVISVSKKTLTSDDIPELPQSKITDLETTLAGKQDTLTAGTGIEITPENQINVTLDTTVFKVVSALPDSPAQGDENKIHLVPAESTGPNNTYTEYVWVNSAWEILGEYTSEVDLTPYLKTVDAQATYATKTELTAHTRNTSNPHGVTADQVGLGNVDNTSDLDKPISTATQAALDLKQDITDNTLETTSKTVPGAINETKERIDNIDQTLDLKKVFAYGVEWTDEGVLTSSALTRIGNLQMHKDLPIQSAMYGCIVKNGALQYKLGATNWTYKEDMTTASVLDGTDGGIYVHIPKFYLWSENEGITHRVYISLLPLVPDAFEVPEMYVSAEKVTLDRTDGSNIKTASVVNTTANFRGGNNSADYDTYLTTDPARCLLGKPATAVSRAKMRTYARNNGEELLCYDWYKALYWLYVIEYANFNCQLAYNAELTAEGYKQGGLGSGVTNLSWGFLSSYNKNNPIVPCGYNYEIGNGTGVKNLTLVGYNENVGITVSVSRWRGLCSPFGDIWTNVEGIYIQQTTEGVEYKSVYATHNPDYFGEVSNHMDYIGGEVKQEGYIQSVNLGNQADIIPLTVGGGANTGMCDYHWIGSDNTTARILLMGSSASNSSPAGFSCWHSEYALAYAYSSVGFRTVIIK